MAVSESELCYLTQANLDFKALLDQIPSVTALSTILPLQLSER